MRWPRCFRFFPVRETVRSFHSSVCCSKKMVSPSARVNSATGTTWPAIWQVMFPTRNSAISRSLGADCQPDSDTGFATSRGAPHVPQLVRPGSFS